MVIQGSLMCEVIRGRLCGLISEKSTAAQVAIHYFLQHSSMQTLVSSLCLLLQLWRIGGNDIAQLKVTLWWYSTGKAGFSTESAGEPINALHGTYPWQDTAQVPARLTKPSLWVCMCQIAEGTNRLWLAHPEHFILPQLTDSHTDTPVTTCRKTPHPVYFLSDAVAQHTHTHTNGGTNIKPSTHACTADFFFIPEKKKTNLC